VFFTHHLSSLCLDFSSVYLSLIFTRTSFRHRVLPSSKWKRPSYDAETKFRKVTNICAYVPQVTIPGFTFPFLLCDTKDIQFDHIGWHDPHHGFDVHDLTKDVPAILAARNIKRDGKSDDGLMFSIVKEWDDQGRRAAPLLARQDTRCFRS